jgi:hypothetical protein
MFNYPPQTLVNRVLPKSRIYTRARVTKRVQELFVTEISQILWKHKLAPETLHLEPSEGVHEIQVFELVLKQKTLTSGVLQAIDKAIPYPVFFRLVFESEVSHTAAYKRPALDASDKWVVGDYYRTAWRPATTPLTALPVALNLKTLYARMLAAHLDIPTSETEPLESMVERAAQATKLKRQIALLESKLKAEKQFNRKVAIHAEIRDLNAELNTRVQHARIV